MIDIEIDQYIIYMMPREFESVVDKIQDSCITNLKESFTARKKYTSAFFGCMLFVDILDYIETRVLTKYSAEHLSLATLTDKRGFLKEHFSKRCNNSSINHYVLGCEQLFVFDSFYYFNEYRNMLINFKGQGDSVC